MTWLHRFSLRTIIFGSFTLVMLLTMGPTYFLISDEVDQSLRASLDMRGSYLARSLAERGALPYQNEQMRKEVLESVQIPEDEGGAFLVDADFKFLGSSAAGLETDPVIQTLRGIDRSKLAHGVGAMSAGTGFVFWAYPARERRPDMIEGNAAGSERIVGYAVVLLPDKQVVEAKTSVKRTLFLAFLTSMAIFMVLLFFISRMFIIRPLADMMVVAKKISDCDLTEKPATHGSDELGQLGSALNRTAENLRITLGKVKGVSEGIATVIEQISHTGDVVAKGAATTAQSVDETSSSMEQMIASLKGIAENVEVLAQSAEESSSSILEMAATNDEVAENIQQLASSVEETTAAIEQMTFSIKQVAKNIDELSATAEETSSSMNEMDVSIGQVETNANETAKLSELVSADADTGMMALQKTIVGIDKIKESSKEAAHVIENLGKKIETIGNILNVIDEVAEQTNLLALNAAIIAAQAGEHGKGFAVVADEIKDLAERTGASTKEISHLIQSVQEESRNAIIAMERGVKNVEEGVRLGGEAEGALKKINESAGKSTQMVKAIARATVEQARGPKQVTNAINRIAETVQQIASATGEQAKGSEQIMKSAERMKAITKHVERSSQEQARGSKQITRSIENINEMVSHLNRAQKEQTKGSEQVMNAVESIKGVSDQQNRSMHELERAIDALAKQADVLRDEVRRFRV
jgi:methyl-accepting chemotaxis protein